MKIQYCNGDILKSNDRILLHSGNTLGYMGAGVAKALSNRFSELLEDYREYLRFRPNKTLGTCCIHIADCDDHHILPVAIATLISQDTIGRTGLHTNYAALESALLQFKRWLVFNQNYWCPNEPMRFSTVKLGCGLGGGDWGHVRNIIERHFDNFEGTITVWDLI